MTEPASLVDKVALASVLCANLRSATQYRVAMALLLTFHNASTAQLFVPFTSLVFDRRNISLILKPQSV